MSLNYLSAGQLVAAFRTGTLTPVDVIEATLERIARFEPSIHAAYAIDAEAARSAAKTAEQRRRTGKPIGALDGVSVAEAAQDFDGTRVFQGLSQMLAMRAAGHALLQELGFLLSPTAPLPAFAADLPCPANDTARPFDHIALP
jgi:hypothetical protein